MNVFLLLGISILTGGFTLDVSESLETKFCFRDALAESSASAFESCSLFVQVDSVATRVDTLEMRIAAMEKENEVVYTSLLVLDEQHGSNASTFWSTRNPASSFASLVSFVESKFPTRSANHIHMDETPRFIAKLESPLKIDVTVSDDVTLEAALLTSKEFNFMLVFKVSYETISPTVAPSPSPTPFPTDPPTDAPTKRPTRRPTLKPTGSPCNGRSTLVRECSTAQCTIEWTAEHRERIFIGGDFDSTSEYADIYSNGSLVGRHSGEGLSCGQELHDTGFIVGPGLVSVRASDQVDAGCGGSHRDYMHVMAVPVC